MAKLSVLKAVWGKKTGYVFLPVRRETWSEGEAYKYPEEWDAIERRVKNAVDGGYDVYWCPLVFTKPRRIKENAHKECELLWADLDYVDPTKLDYKPSVAWKSSDDRYQGLWFLSAKHGIDAVEQLNRKMTYSIGADKGGWDVTQVLRVPGTPNFKYSPPQQGKLLWAEKTFYDFESLDSALVDDSPMAVEEDASIEKLMEGWDIPSRARELLLVDPAEVTVGERSDRLWEIETSLVEAGLPVMTIVKIIAACPWNKFKGRRDEYNQIYQEVLKAEQHVKVREHKKAEPTMSAGVELVVVDDLWAVPFAKFMAKTIEKPQWLIEGIWQKSTYGMMAGEPKTYKSVNALDMAMSIASGLPYLGKFPVHTTGPVIYIQEENNEATIQDRAFKIAYQKGLLTTTGFGLAYPEDLQLYFCNNYGVDLTSKESRQLLEGTIAKVHPVMVILDPLYMMLGGADENSASEVRDILKWLTYLRNTYSTAIMICHHYNKSGSGKSGEGMRGGSRVRGTSQFHGWVESALYVKKPAEPGKILIEREFRSFPSTADLSIKIDMGEPGELKYVPLIEGAEALIIDEIKKDEICAALSLGSRTLDELKSSTAMPRPLLMKILGELTLDEIIVCDDGKGRNKRYSLKEKGGVMVGDLGL